MMTTYLNTHVWHRLRPIVADMRVKPDRLVFGAVLFLLGIMAGMILWYVLTR